MNPYDLPSIKSKNNPLYTNFIDKSKLESNNIESKQTTQPSYVGDIPDVLPEPNDPELVCQVKIINKFILYI